QRVAGRGRALDGGGDGAVEAEDGGGAGGLLVGHEVVQGDHFAAGRSDEELLEVLRVVPVLPLHLGDDLVLLPVFEKVAEAAAGVAVFHGAGDVLHGDAKLGGLPSVDGDDAFRAVHFQVGIDLAEDG